MEEHVRQLRQTALEMPKQEKRPELRLEQFNPQKFSSENKQITLSN